mgnify:CR=1 FL=1
MAKDTKLAGEVGSRDAREVEEVSADFSQIKHDKKRRFLEFYARNGSIARSAKILKMSRTSHYRWSNPKHHLYDGEYVAAFEVAKKLTVDRLEAEARRRAVQGVEEPVFYKGEIVGYKLKYSDGLLKFLLKGNAPEKFKERGEQEHKGELTAKSVDLSNLSAEDLKKIIEKL